MPNLSYLRLGNSPCGPKRDYQGHYPIFFSIKCLSLLSGRTIDSLPTNRRRFTANIADKDHPDKGPHHNISWWKDPGDFSINVLLQRETLLYPLDCGLRITCDECCMSDWFSWPETPDDRLILWCQLCLVLDSRPPGLTDLPTIPDILVPAWL